jgi:DNA-binding IclR family transcriptional regulator
LQVSHEENVMPIMGTSPRDQMLREDGYVPAAEYAEAAGLHLSTVHRRLKEGLLAGQQLDGRFWYVHAIKALRSSGLDSASVVYKRLEKLAKTTGKKPQPARST